MILDEIVASKEAEVAQLRRRVTLVELRQQAEAAGRPQDFAGALRSQDGSVRLIAEIKRKSPSKGVFRADLDAAQLARTYAAGGAACISVLTDEPFFLGSLDDLRAVRRAVELPLLRKEFIIDEAQIYEARAAGADAILLIAAILDDGRLAAFHHLAGELGMGALVEIHDEAELRRVLPLHPALIGINNRDLKTFRVDLATTERLRPLIPAGSGPSPSAAADAAPRGARAEGIARITADALGPAPGRARASALPGCGTAGSRVPAGSGPSPSAAADAAPRGAPAEGIARSTADALGPASGRARASALPGCGTAGSRVPAECIVVSESGIHSRADVARLRRAGVQAILVGESLIMADNTAAQMHALMGSALDTR
jgi:indole-3-glycerol phosphate synthase